MKIRLINTGLDENSPPLNLVYLATSLKLNGFEEVRIIDPTFNNEGLLKEVKGIDCVGISAITKYYKKACTMAKEIRESSDIPVIIGGVHISSAPESLSRDFELGVIGEGENLIVELCRILQQNGKFLPEKLKDKPGIVYWNEGELVRTSPQQLIENLDDIPIPDYRLVDERYFRKKWINWTERKGRLMHIITTRGCPYNCIFCATKRFWKATRFHSADRIFKEVNELATNWGIDHIVVDDDLFLTRKKRLEEFADLLEHNGLNGKIAFSCNARSNLLDENMCRILRRIGVKALNFGFESGSNRILSYLKGEDITVEHHKRAIKLCNEYRFKIYGSLIFGSPTESVEDMKKTLRFIDYAIKNNCHKVWAFVMTPLPGTPLWETARQRGKVSDNMDWDMLDLNSCDNPMFLEPDIASEEFKNIFLEATAKLDKAWLRDKWIKTIFLEYRKVMRRTLENPKRAIAIMRNIFSG
jgi:anaerobic magnesium-protoporphyrin IX monomethyl ester cyclase